jgi:hypothetical protein
MIAAVANSPSAWRPSSSIVQRPGQRLLRRLELPVDLCLLRFQFVQAGHRLLDVSAGQHLRDPMHLVGVARVNHSGVASEDAEPVLAVRAVRACRTSAGAREVRALANYLNEIDLAAGR